MAVTWGHTWKMGKRGEQKIQEMDDYFMHIYSIYENKHCSESGAMNTLITAPSFFCFQQ